MTCISEDIPVLRPRNRARHWLRRLARALTARRRPRAPRLDPRDLSDHMKRDLGFLDGRG